MLTTSLLAVLIAAPPDTITRPLDPFDPASAEVTVDDDGTLEILVFDDEGAMIGALLATPTTDHVQIDASFADGYASFALVLDPVTLPMQAYRSDLPVETAGERVNTMLAFVDEPSPTMESKRSCIMKLAITAAICGAGAAFPPATVHIIVGCLGNAVGALCECAPYLPVKIC
jgi:hypothetical protein